MQYYFFTWVGVVLVLCKDLCICPRKGHREVANARVPRLVGGLLGAGAELQQVGDTFKIMQTYLQLLLLVPVLSNSHHNIPISHQSNFQHNVIWIFLF